MIIAAHSLSSWIIDDMITGIKKHGHEINLYDFNEYEECDVAIIMGWHDKGSIKCANYYRGKVPVIIITDGYVRRKLVAPIKSQRYLDWCHFGIGLNYPAGYSEIPYRDDYPSDRWLKLNTNYFNYKTGYKTLVAYQSGQSSLGVSRYRFYKKISNWNISKVRIHPCDIDIKTIKKVKKLFPNSEISHGKEVDLNDDLRDVTCVISYDSNINVEATIKGCTCIEEGRSMSWPVSLKLGEQKPLPRIDYWVNWLAYQQWTKEEMSNGNCWDYIKEIIY